MSKSPSLRRIQADIRELQMDPSSQYHAAPLENDMFVWHFTIRGAEGTDFEDGIYHGKILLPAEYPFKPPNIMFLTPNGRFETNMKLCLSFSAYHPELWQPAWGIRLILEALISFLPTKGDGAIGALDWTSDERKRLAKKSWDYSCPTCGNCKVILDKWSQRARAKAKAKQSKDGSASGSGSAEGNKSRFQKEIEQLHAMQAATEGTKENGNKDEDEHKDDKQTCKDKDKDNQNDKKDCGKLNQSERIHNANEIHHDAEHDTKTEANSESNDNNNNNNNTDMKSAGNDNKTGEGKEIQIQNKKISNDPNHVQPKEEDNDESVSVATTPTGEQESHQNLVAESPLLSDPVVHGGIVIFSAIVFLLIRKLQDIIGDMKDLENLRNGV